MTANLEKNNSAVEFATAMRVHISLNTGSVERSLPFYQTLFGIEPTKVRTGYAKFEVAEPPLNFTLNATENFQPGGAISHFGIQVKSTGEVLTAKERFVEAGLATFSEDEVTCCYAVQDKVWVTDPDGNSWEVFVVLDADAPVHSLNRNSQEMNASCACDTEPVTGRRTLELITKDASGKACC